MKSLGTTAEWARERRSPSLPTTQFELVVPKLDQFSEKRLPICTWPLKVGHSQMVAAQGNEDLTRLRPLQEPPFVRPRSILQRVLATPSNSGPSTPLHSPRRRSSVATSCIGCSQRVSDKFDKRDFLAPHHCTVPDFSAYESSSNCSSRCNSPLPPSHFRDGPIPSDDEDEGDKEVLVSVLRRQVALLLKSLEEEKKRRASEQQLMQTKIIELQTLIRRNSDDVTSDDVDNIRNASPSRLQGVILTQETEWLKNLQNQSWSASLEEKEEQKVPSSCSSKQDNWVGDKTVKLQLARLRAQMHAIVIDTQRETQTLRAQLEGAKRSNSKKENQLTLETTIKICSLEQKHAVATSRLAQEAANRAAQIEKLQVEKHELVARMQAQREHLRQLEHALDEKHVLSASH